MGPTVEIPIHLVVDPSAVRSRHDDIREAVLVATEQSVRRAVSAVSVGGTAIAHDYRRPVVRWAGPGLPDLAAEDRASCEADVISSIRHAAISVLAAAPSWWTSADVVREFSGIVPPTHGVERKMLTSTLEAEVLGLRSVLLGDGTNNDPVLLAMADDRVPRFEAILLQRQQLLVRSQRQLAELTELLRRQGPQADELGAVRLALAAEHLYTHGWEVFVLGFAAGVELELPPGRVADFLDEVEREPADFYSGVLIGVGIGLWNELWSVISLVVSMLKIGIYLSPVGFAYFASRELFSSIYDPDAYATRRGAVIEHVKKLLASVQRFHGRLVQLGVEAANNETAPLGHTFDLGVGVGRGASGLAEEGFFGKNVFGKGQMIGEIIGLILFDIFIDLIAAIPTVGAGVIVSRVVTAAKNAKRAVQATIRLFRHLVNAVRRNPLLKGLLADLARIGDELAHLVRIVEGSVSDLAQGGLVPAPTGVPVSMLPPSPVVRPSVGPRPGTPLRAVPVQPPGGPTGTPRPSLGAGPTAARSSVRRRPDIGKRTAGKIVEDLNSLSNDKIIGRKGLDTIQRHLFAHEAWDRLIVAVAKASALPVSDVRSRFARQADRFTLAAIKGSKAELGRALGHVHPNLRVLGAREVGGVDVLRLARWQSDVEFQSLIRAFNDVVLVHRRVHSSFQQKKMLPISALLVESLERSLKVGGPVPPLATRKAEARRQRKILNELRPKGKPSAKKREKTRRKRGTIGTATAGSAVIKESAMERAGFSRDLIWEMAGHHAIPVASGGRAHSGIREAMMEATGSSHLHRVEVGAIVPNKPGQANPLGAVPHTIIHRGYDYDFTIWLRLKLRTGQDLIDEVGQINAGLEGRGGHFLFEVAPSKFRPETWPPWFDFNTSPAEDLALLPGIGKRLADRIVKEREKGDFISFEDVVERIPRLPERTMDNLKRLVEPPGRGDHSPPVGLGPVVPPQNGLEGVELPGPFFTPDPAVPGTFRPPSPSDPDLLGGR